MKKFVCFVVLAFGAFGVAGPAAAATYKVAVGEQSRPPAGVPKQASLNAFFPGKLVIHVGDKVTFTNFGFHTVTYVKGTAAPVFVPSPDGAPYATLVDAAGTPFAFPPLAKFIYNALALGPGGGKVINGSKTVNSGILFGPAENKPGVITYTFSKRGVYKLICLVHGSMMAVVVTVKPKTALFVDTPAQVKARGAKQMAAAWAAAKKAAETSIPPANTVYAGAGNKATVMSFFPQRLTVKAGTTVTFVLRTPTMEIHDMAFGPADYIQKLMEQTDLIPQGPGSPNQVSPFLIFGSDPGKPQVYDGRNHGNGFFVSPMLGVGPGLVTQTSITFPTPGTYHYFCLIHGPDMSGDIVVTP